VIDEIRIRNLGVISEAVLPLGPGFTAITGETGAGKTMVVTALGLLRGERAEAATVRRGAEAAVVEGRWLITDASRVQSILDDVDASLDQNELLLSRSVTSEGRSRAVVAGRQTPAGTLGDLGDALVAVHGQSEQVRLRSASAQREALDRFGGVDLSSALHSYQHAYRQWKADAAELVELTTARDARALEADELRVAVSEIEALAPQPGEDEALATLAERLTHTEDLRVALLTAREALSSESDNTDVLGLIEVAKRSVDRAAGIDGALASVATELSELSARLVDASHELSSQVASLEGEGERDLDLVQERRAELATVIRRYGPTLDDVIAYVATASQRLLELDADDTRIEELTQLVTAHATSVTGAADHLTQLRSQAATALAEAVTAELHALAMPDARLHVSVSALSEPAVHGADVVEILLAPHSGSEPRPVAKGASGGELSRIMLALEVVIAGADTVPTYVFDEVDAGVGGAAAIEVGRRLAMLSQNAQVIVVTHLAQVAAFATNHLRVFKDTSGEVTASSVTKLDGHARLSEMARLLSGLADSESGLTHARELLDLAAITKSVAPNQN
jgi:DNA repair protein RecN (Recombination protein N)